MKNSNNRVYCILFGTVNAGGKVMQTGVYPIFEDKAVINGELVPVQQLEYMSAFMDRGFQDYRILNGILTPFGTTLDGVEINQDILTDDEAFFSAALAAFMDRAVSVGSMITDCATFLNDNLEDYAKLMNASEATRTDYTLPLVGGNMSGQYAGFLATKVFYDVSRAYGRNALTIKLDETSDVNRLAQSAKIIQIFERANQVALFTFNYDFPVTSGIEVTLSDEIILVGPNDPTTYTLSAVVKNNSVVVDNPTLEWESSDNNLATVDSDGEVVIVENAEDGTVIITVTYDGVTASCSFTINRVLDYVATVTPSVLVISTTITGQVDTTVTLNGNPYTPTSITYAVDDTAIATVDETGLVTGVDEGTTVLTVTINVENHPAIVKTINVEVNNL